MNDRVLISYMNNYSDIIVKMIIFNIYVFNINNIFNNRKKLC